VFRVALVQNQSEMAHYGYADARSLISDLGYEVTLYTAQNVRDLSNALPSYRTDALVLGSNALNDKTIRAYFEEAETQEVIEEFLERERGLLSFHQLRFAGMEDARFSFLPEPLGKISPVARSLGETSAIGKLVIPSGAETHTSLLYPNQVIAGQIQEHALSFRSLQGLYWHYWQDPDLAEWDVLLADAYPHDRPRALVVASKETGAHRVLLSALTLDWQRQRDVLENALAYVVEGRHNTAVLSSNRADSQVVAYLTATLEARRFPFRRYYLDEGLHAFDCHVENGVHTNVVLGDDVTLDVLRAKTTVQLDDLLSQGALNLLSIEPGDDQSRLSGLSSISNQSEAYRLLWLAELAVQAELREGNVDGSFWGTAETLQVLEALPEVSTDFAPLVDRALRLADEHDCDGSYDETFGVTCALYWMRARYLGADSPGTRKTEGWIRARVERFETREQVLAYRMFAVTGQLQPADSTALRQILDGVLDSDPSEIDLIAYIKAAISAEIVEPLPSLVDHLLAVLQNEWVDLATTASAASALLDARLAMRKAHEPRSQLRRDLDDTIRRAVVSLQEKMEPSAVYPWEGKASTSVRCLEAWVKFDTQVAPPIYGVIDQLLGWDRVATEIATTRTSLAVLDELKQENSQMAQEIAVLRPQVRDASEDLRQIRTFKLALLLALYCLFVLCVAATQTEDGGITELLELGFVEPWGVHVGIATIALAAAVVPWHRLAERRRSA
jgi:hypothetical protein